MKKLFLFLMLSSLVSPHSSFAAIKGRESIEAPALSSLKEEEFLELIERRAFDFFWYEANPRTGLIKDRANNFTADEYKVASTASVGFGLTALCVAEKRGWLKHEEAYTRVLKTLKFFRDKLEKEHGFFYHFLHLDLGKPLRKSEVSSIDTALFLAGALFAGEFYKGSEVEEIARSLYLDVDWHWMLNGGTTLSMGYKPAHLPDAGFIADRWNNYSEAMLLYLLAIGSPTHPIPAEYWYEWKRPIRKYKNYTLIASAPLFTHQYSHLWIDFRNKHDNIADYFRNSIDATLANRQFCIDNMDRFKTYGPNSWGLTASEGPAGYSAYGAAPSIFPVKHDGTIAPTAAGGSMMFTSKESIACLKNLYNQYKQRLWGIYGFSDSFNIDKDWFATDVIGIDQGALLLGIENYRSGMLWKYFMRNEFIKTAMQKAGFQQGSKELSWKRPQIEAKFTKKPPVLDADLKEWKGVPSLELVPNRHLEYLYVTDSSKDCLGKFYFMWDRDFLYLAAEVIDNEIIARKRNNSIYKDDCIELFIDAKNDGFIWRNSSDFQFGFAPGGFEGKPIVWEWFHQDKFQDEVKFAFKQTKIGDKNAYILEAAIKWDFLAIEPKSGYLFGISPAIHDLDESDNSPQAKLNWFYIYQERDPRIILGKILLEE